MGRFKRSIRRKNWSSVVLWNCAHPSNEKISVDKVNNPNHDGAFFHRFSWLRDDEIGKLPCDWNWLVGWYKPKTELRAPFIIQKEDLGSKTTELRLQHAMEKLSVRNDGTIARLISQIQR